METIIGLGKAGCAIADRFAQYPQYDIYKMDVGLKRTPRTYGLKPALTPEAHEESIGNLRRFFKGIEGNVLLARRESSTTTARNI